MPKIALISDNHSYFGEEIMPTIMEADEVWHAGDIGSISSLQPILDAGKVLKAVYGNIDDKTTRNAFNEDLIWTCEGIKIYMTHIGGYPGRYNLRAKEIIEKERPNLFICGHSHICKVLPDKRYDLLHMNPGAYGYHGFHVMRTILKFDIFNKRIQNLAVVELGLRNQKK